MCSYFKFKILQLGRFVVFFFFPGQFNGLISVVDVILFIKHEKPLRHVVRIFSHCSTNPKIGTHQFAFEHTDIFFGHLRVPQVHSNAF